MNGLLHGQEGGVDASRVKDVAVLTLPFLDITVDAAGLE